jgi:hypothetical protein
MSSFSSFPSHLDFTKLNSVDFNEHCSIAAALQQHYSSSGILKSDIFSRKLFVRPSVIGKTTAAAFFQEILFHWSLNLNVVKNINELEGRDSVVTVILVSTIPWWYILVNKNLAGARSSIIEG